MKINIAYQKAAWNLATKTIPAAGWGKFIKDPTFPDRATADIKLEWLDRYLKAALAPQDIRANPNLHHEHIRGDLNKYRPWLLRATLQHLYQTHLNPSSSTILLPEDLPKIIDDLHLFHKHHGLVAEKTGSKDKGTIQSYGTLTSFRKAMDMVRPPPSPLQQDERESAFAAHLREYGGDGGAETIATLSNGTMVIQLHTEAASISLGSPHWCTAYRNKETWFNEYKDHLIMILGADGRRHQLHFRHHQFMDANDRLVSLPEAVSCIEGLADSLQPILKKVLAAPGRISPMDVRDYFEMCEGIEVFEDEIIQARIENRALKGVIRSGQTHFIKSIIYHCLNNQRRAISFAAPEGVCKILNAAASAQNEAALEILKVAAEDTLLTESLVRPEGIPSALIRLATRLPGKIRHNDYLNFRKGCEMHPAFMEALASPEAFPRLIREEKRSGNEARLSSLKAEFEDLKQMIEAKKPNQTSQTLGIRSAATCQLAHAQQSMLSRYQL